MKYCCLLAIVSIIGGLLGDVKSARAQMTVARSVQTGTEVESGVCFFEGSWDEALAESKKTGKPIFMDCYIMWCEPCKKLVQEVFTQPEAGDYFNTHFINVKMDMLTEQGKVVGKQYEVKGYPTLLFTDGDGNMLHRIVGGPDGQVLLKEAARVVQGSGYARMNRVYTEGNRQFGFIQEYMEVLGIAGESAKASKVCQEYFSTLDKAKLKERKYWDLFRKYVKDVDSDEAKYVYKNRKVFVRLFGEQEMNSKFYQLYNGKVVHYWKKEEGKEVFDEKGFEKYARKLMKKDIYGKEIIISNARMNHAVKTGDWKRYVQLGNERLVAGEKSNLIVYNWGVQVNTTCKDMTVREEVAKWMDRFAAACDGKPDTSESDSLKNSYLTIADKLRHPEKNDKNYPRR